MTGTILIAALRVLGSAPRPPQTQGGEPQTGGARGVSIASIAELEAATGGEPARAEQEKELAQLEKEWNDAVAQRDFTTLRRMMADDFAHFSTTAPGTAVPKEQIESLLPPPPKDTSVKTEVGSLATRIFGDAAVVTAQATTTITQEGRAQVEKGQFVHVWMRRKGRWLLAGDIWFSPWPPATP